MLLLFFIIFIHISKNIYILIFEMWQVAEIRYLFVFILNNEVCGCYFIYFNIALFRFFCFHVYFSQVLVCFCHISFRFFYVYIVYITCIYLF